MEPRLLLLSAAFGSGHEQAARSIAQAYSSLEPGLTAHVVNFDQGLVHAASRGYLTLLRHAPGAFRSLYHAPVGAPARILVRAVLQGPVLRAVERSQPAVIVATHPFPGLAAAHLRRGGLIASPVAMAVTDFLPHPLWVHAGVDLYFVASGEAAGKLQALGVAPERISVSGIPIRPAFGEPVHSAPADLCRRILVMGGGLGLGPVAEAVRSLAAVSYPYLQVTVVCGSNDALRNELYGLVRTDGRFEVLGRTDQIPGLMARSDLLVTKPGGVTCSEALACGLPMLLLRPLPGHEEENGEFLYRIGAGITADDGQIGLLAARLLGSDQHALATMRERAKLAGRPLAAHTVAAQLAGLARPGESAAIAG